MIISPINIRVYPVKYKVKKLIQMCLVIYSCNNMKNIFILVFVLALTSGQNFNCGTGADSIDLVQTGKVNVYASAVPNQRQHTFLVPITEYIVPPTGFQITASVGEYVMGLQNEGVDFMVGGYQIGNSASANLVLFSSRGSSWSKMVINYLATSRKYFFLGSFSISNYQLIPSGVNTYTYKHSLTYWNTIPSLNVYQQAYISGLKTTTSQITTIRIDSVAIEKQTGKLVISFTMIINQPVQSISFAYMWWHHTMGLPFSGFVPQLGSSSPYQFVGVKEITSGGFSFAGSAFGGSGQSGTFICSGSLCKDNCISISKCIEQNGKVEASTCFLCGLDEIYKDRSCQSTKKCGQNMKLVGSSCQCLDGYSQIAPTYCFKCPQHSQWNGKDCICNPNFYKESGSCYPCPPNSRFNTVTQRCECPFGLKLNKGTCEQCLSTQVWDKQRKTCVCDPESMNIDGVCDKCPTNSLYHITHGTCICVDGMYMINNICVRCGQNEVFNAFDKKCQCRSGYHNISGSCRVCQLNSRFNGAECQCYTGWTNVAGRCIRCGVNQVARGLQCVCTPTFYKFKGVCICPLNSRIVQGRCVCNSNNFLRNGVCLPERYNPTPYPPTPCPDKTYWNQTHCLCVSPLNMIQGTCQMCQQNSSYDFSRKQCICKGGYYQEQHVCLKCHATCQTCYRDGPEGCLSCRNDARLEGTRCRCYNAGVRGVLNDQGVIVIQSGGTCS